MTKFEKKKWYDLHFTWCPCYIFLSPYSRWRIMPVSPKLQLQQLVQLQKIDDQILEHKKALADIPIQLDSARAELEEKKNILKVVTEEIETLQ